VSISNNSKMLFKLFSFLCILFFVIQVTYTETKTTTILAKAGTKVTLYPNGKVKELILAKNYKDDEGRV
jgi:hypothetical protein